MSRWLCTAAILCLAVSVPTIAAPATPESCLVVPGKSIGPIALGMTREQVTTIWGTPDVVNVDRVDYKLMRQASITFDQAGRVIFIVSSDLCLRTAEGIGVDDKRSRLYAAYGTPSQTRAQKWSDLVVQKRFRLRIGTEFHDVFLDSYPGRGVGFISVQRMHVNGYTTGGQAAVVVPVDPEPMVETIGVHPPENASEQVQARMPQYAR